MQPDPGPTWLRRLLLSVVALPTAAGGALLTVMSFLGLYVRPTSDDWCAAWKTRDMGIFGITEDFYLTQNGRITNAFISGMVYSEGLIGPKLLPGMIVLSLGVGLVLLLRRLWIMAGWQTPMLVLVGLAVVIEVLLFAAAHNPYQALMWAPATISHTLPTVFAVWSVLFALWAGRSARRGARIFAIAAAFLIGFGIGTLNEPFMVMAGLMSGAAGLLLIPRLGMVRTWYPCAWCAGLALGMLVGYAVLYTSPGAQWRRQQAPAGSSLFSSEQLSSAFQDWLKVADVLTSQWTYLAAVSVGLLAGLVSRSETREDSGTEPTPPGGRKWVTAAAVVLPVPIILLGSYVVLLGVQQGYGPTGWTYSRIWFNFVAPLIFALCFYAVLAGRAVGMKLAARSGPAEVPALAVAITLAASFVLCCTAALVPEVQKMTTATVTRAAAWDRQDTRIRKEAARGADEVTYRPLHIGNLAEPFFTKTYARDWVAGCASRYYGVERMSRPAPAG